MGVIKFLSDISGLFNWNTDDNPTSEQDYMNAVKNWQETEKNLVDTVLWQPTTAYAVGNIVKTPSLPSQWCLVCTTAGTSGENEPSYSGKTVWSSVSDGSVTWKIHSILYVQEQAKRDRSYPTVSSSTDFTNAASLSLTAGTWLICGNVSFASNATGVRGLRILRGSTVEAADSKTAINGLVTALSASVIIVLASTTTVYLAVQQNSGSSLSADATITAQKLSDHTSYE